MSEGRASVDLWVAIPAKPLALGKSRIALPAAERVALNRRFLAHVVGVATRTVPPARVVVISRDVAALAIARAAGARALRERGDGALNEALGQAAAYAAERGARGVLSLFADLPHCTPADLHAMIVAFTDYTLAIAPDERGTGSNALLMAPGALPYRHGPDSFWRHVAGATTVGLAVSVVSRPGLRRDVDHAADLHALDRERWTPALHPDR